MMWKIEWAEQSNARTVYTVDRKGNVQSVNFNGTGAEALAQEYLAFKKAQDPTAFTPSYTKEFSCGKKL